MIAYGPLGSDTGCCGSDRAEANLDAGSGHRARAKELVLIDAKKCLLGERGAHKALHLRRATSATLWPPRVIRSIGGDLPLLHSSTLSEGAT